MRIIYSICIAVAVAFTTSCSYKQNHMLFERVDVINLAPDTTSPNGLTAKSTYRIQPRDILQLRNLQNIKYIVDELPASTAGISGAGGTASQGQTFEVEEDGTVALPALGHIYVSGLTRVEATKKIEDLYRKDLLKAPIIELKITNLKVTIFGETNSQGNFPLLKDNTTLVEMLGQAGGLTANANEKNIRIIRGNGRQKRVTEIDLGNLSSIDDPRAILQNGDIIYVSQNRRAVRVDKFQNLNTIIQPVTLLLSTALIIYTISR